MKEFTNNKVGSQLQSGSKTAEVIRLYDDASDELLAMLTRRLGNRVEAEEIAQDAFEKLVQLADREDISDLRRYFFTMANRLALNVLRRRKLEGAYLASEQHSQQGASGNNQTLGPERILSGVETLMRAKRALARLPEKTRHIFLLHRFEGYTYPEIARQLELSQKSIEYHMNRALSALLDSVYGEGE